MKTVAFTSCWGKDYRWKRFRVKICLVYCLGGQVAVVVLDLASTQPFKVFIAIYSSQTAGNNCFTKNFIILELRLFLYIFF